MSSGRLGPIGRRPTWTNTANSTPDMLAGRRIAQQMLERPGEQVPLVNGWEWGSLLVEVQVLLAPDQGIIFVSSNSSKGNAALERAFPDVHRFRRTVRDALQRRIDARFPEGVVPPRGSSAINNDTIARRAVKVLRLLSQSDWSLLIVPNGENRHAEQAIESYQQKQYPTIARTGPATGTRPPCLGCIIHMARPDVDALKYYEAVEAPIQVGDYYTKATSGARSQYLAHNIPVQPPDSLPKEDYQRLLAGTVDDLADIRPKIEVVWVARDFTRIPRSPDDVTTPEINYALDSSDSSSAARPSTSKSKQ